MPRLKRSQAYSLRGLIHEVEKLIPSNDRSQIAEWERDLVAEACVALWDVDVKRLVSCLRRLSTSPARKDAWNKVLSMATEIFSPAESTSYAAAA